MTLTSHQENVIARQSDIGFMPWFFNAIQIFFLFIFIWLLQVPRGVVKYGHRPLFVLVWKSATIHVVSSSPDRQPLAARYGARSRTRDLVGNLVSGENCRSLAISDGRRLSAKHSTHLRPSDAPPCLAIPLWRYGEGLWCLNCYVLGPLS